MNDFLVTCDQDYDIITSMLSIAEGSLPVQFLGEHLVHLLGSIDIEEVSKVELLSSLVNLCSYAKVRSLLFYSLIFA